jgi:predicted outer membrane repeat protein
MKRLIFPFLWMLIFSALSCNLALAKSVYLSAEGSDDNNGLSVDKPVLTFKKAYTIAQSGDIIHVSGIIDLSAEVSNVIGFPIVRDLVIQGTSKDTDGFDGQSKTRLFSIKEGTVTLSNLTLKNGATDEPNTHGGAFVVLNNAVVKGDNLLFSGNRAAGTGGAIQIVSTKGIQLKNCTFSKNEASRGGAIGITDSGNADVVFLFENCAFVANKAVAAAGNGGGSAIHSILGVNAVNNTINIVNSTFAQNSARDANGGAIYFHTAKSQGTVNIVNCTITKNTSEAKSINNGAGVFMGKTELKLNIYNSIIEGNTIFNNTPIFADLRMVAEPTADNLQILNSFVGRYAGSPIDDAVKAAIAPSPTFFNYLSISAKERSLKTKLGVFNEAGYYPLKTISPAVNFGEAEYLTPYSVTDQTEVSRSFTDGKCYAGAVEKIETITPIK